MPDLLVQRTGEPVLQPVARGSIRAIASWSPAVLVGAVWAVMLLSDLYFVRAYGRNVPYWEDWQLVPRVTVEKVDLDWLFSQHVEHRLPLPKLILVGLIKATHLNFRAGLYFNTFGLAIVALAMMLTARHLRGRASYADIVFPLLLLNWGHWNNILWNWQVQFICSTLLGTAVLLVILWRGNRLTVGTALVAGCCLVLLPLCGANGLALAPLPALWLAWAGALSIKERGSRAKIAGVLAIVLAAVTLGITVCYGIGTHQSAAVGKRLGFAPAVATFVAFLGQGFGRFDRSAVVVREMLLPVAVLLGCRVWLRRWPRPKELLVLAFCVLLARGLQYQCESEHLPLPIPSRRTAWGIVALASVALCVWLLGQNVLNRRTERLRSLGVLCYFGGLAALAAGLAWGRAGALSDVHDTPRYYTLAVAVPCAVFLVLELYGGHRLLQLARPLLVIAVLVMAWGHTMDGRALAAGRLQGLDSFRRDLQAGLPADEIVRRQPEGAVFVRPLVPIDYAQCLMMLRDAGHPEFQRVKDALAPLPSW